jgi:hypothetical protein
MGIGHADWLSAEMDFDHVISVDARGRVSDGPADVHAPESVIGTDADGQILQADYDAWVAGIEAAGWGTFTDGYSGQQGNFAPAIMHASEYIGGHLAEDIVRRPGLYAAVTVETLDDSEEAAGWAIVFRRVPFREPGYYDCPCCGETVISADGTDLVCADCELAGCESSWDAGGELGFWSCDRPDTDDSNESDVPTTYPAMAYVRDTDGELTDAFLVHGEAEWRRLAAIQPDGYRLTTE